MSISLEETKQIVAEFHKDNRSLKDTKFVVKEKAADINKNYASKEYETLQGAYLPKNDAVIIISSTHKNKEDVLQTLKHEVYGHAALYKLSIHEKKELLDNVKKLKNTPEFKDIYARVDKQYPRSNSYHKAEEVYSYIAEKNPSGYRKVENPTLKVKSMEDVKKISTHLQNKIISGQAKQKIVPLKNSKSFRVEKSIPKAEKMKAMKEIKSRHSGKDKDIEVQQNPSFRLRIKVTDSLEVKSAIAKIEGNAQRSINNKRTVSTNTKQPTINKAKIAAAKSSIKKEASSKMKEASKDARGIAQKKKAFSAMKSKQPKEISKAPKGRDR